MNKTQLRKLGEDLQTIINAHNATPEEALMIFLGAAYGQADELGLTPRQLFERAAHVWDGALVRRETTIHMRPR